MPNPGETCYFCGCNRTNCLEGTRFFNLPHEPGMKRLRWLQVFGIRPFLPSHRVCSLHFRSGRPVNDPSHDDFVPHLNLANNPSQEFLNNREKILTADVELIREKIKTKQVHTVGDNKLLPLLSMKNNNSRPSILQRKRPRAKQSLVANENIINDDDDNDDGPPKLQRMVPIENTTFGEKFETNYCNQNPQSVSKTNYGQYDKLVGNPQTAVIPLNQHFVESTGIQARRPISMMSSSAPVAFITNSSCIQQPQIVYQTVMPLAQPPLTFLQPTPNQTYQKNDLLYQQTMYTEQAPTQSNEEQGIFSQSYDVLLEYEGGEGFFEDAYYYEYENANV
uniref:THAP-type domain-containing protein n=1 Tax=Panagrolaimus sp. ES5 TaxID=591445 RepID=A0AC34F3C0_9BILA